MRAKSRGAILELDLYCTDRNFNRAGCFRWICNARCLDCKPRPAPRKLAAIALPEEKALRLAPTFDHGASLTRNISDAERKERLESRDKGQQIPHFASRARSAFYASPADDRTLGTLEAFARFAQTSPTAANIWLEKIRSVTAEEIKAIIQEVPPDRMSEVARRFTLAFTLALIMANQQRLLKL